MQPQIKEPLLSGFNGLRSWADGRHSRAWRDHTCSPCDSPAWGPNPVPQPYHGLEPTLKEAAVEIFLQSPAFIQKHELGASLLKEPTLQVGR